MKITTTQPDLARQLAGPLPEGATVEGLIRRDDGEAKRLMLYRITAGTTKGGRWSALRTFRDARERDAYEAGFLAQQTWIRWWSVEPVR